MENRCYVFHKEVTEHLAKDFFSLQKKFIFCKDLWTFEFYLKCALNLTFTFDFSWFLEGSPVLVPAALLQ